MALSKLFKDCFSEIILSDGGLASELERDQQDLNSDLWSGEVLIKNEKAVYDVHMKYLKAGSQIITTSGYQLSMNGLKKHEYTEEECIEIFKRSVQVAKKAVSDFMRMHPSQHQEPVVAISMGCYGATLHDGSEYTGDYTIDESQLTAFHYERLMVYEKYLPLHMKQNTLYLFETIPNKLEAQCIKKAIQMVNNKMNEYCVSFACSNESQLNDHNELSEVVSMLEDEPQILCIGINCTNPKYINSLIHIIQSTSTKRIMIYPNMGEEWDSTTHDYVPHTGIQTNEEFLQLSKQWIKSGIHILGGCCRTTPELIQTLSNAYHKQ